ncbi:hypothetical protein A0H81_08257 [Grifola frondosa]|uniref:Uncharacterized protein n=1 Tax=Grifola frondosa TaxID=5627 RepID=A0A1C7M4B7_GRIFR|nr:hypothetical protein A0H81_08257 [Grifola frondosa]
MPLSHGSFDVGYTFFDLERNPHRWYHERPRRVVIVVVMQVIRHDRFILQKCNTDVKYMISCISYCPTGMPVRRRSLPTSLMKLWTATQVEVPGSGTAFAFQPIFTRHSTPILPSQLMLELGLVSRISKSAGHAIVLPRDPILADPTIIFSRKGSYSHRNVSKCTLFDCPKLLVFQIQRGSIAALTIQFRRPLAAKFRRSGHDRTIWVRTLASCRLSKDRITTKRPSLSEDFTPPPRRIFHG